MVRAEKSSDDNQKLGGNENETDGVPAFEHLALELEIVKLAAWQRRASITCLRNGRLNERAVIAAASKLVLNPQPAFRTEILGPLLVDLALEIEFSSFVGDVPRRGVERKDDPEQEGIHGEEGPIVKQDARPSDDGRQDSQTGSDGRYDELWAIPDANDVGVGPDVEPRHQQADDTDDGIAGKDQVCDKQRPFEPVPAQFLGESRLAVPATEPTGGNTVVVLVCLARHPRLSRPESLDSPSSLGDVQRCALLFPSPWAWLQQRVGKLGRLVVDAQRDVRLALQ